MKKVLVVAGKMHCGGLETMVMNFFRHLDRTQVSFDFMLNYEEPGIFDDEIRKLGGKIFIMPRLLPKNIFKYISSVNKFFKVHKGEYDILHGHITSAGVIYLIIARIHGIKTRIIHSHYAETKNNKYGRLEKLMLLPLRFCADYYFACSDKAAKFCFGKNIINKPNYKLIKNGIVVEKFLFNPETRLKIRNEMNVSDKFVICNIGRFEEQKNHEFLLEVFNNVHKIDKDSVLLLIGSGSLLEKSKAKIKSYNLEKAVIIYEYRNDIAEVLQGIDAFVLPSIFEGLPVVGVEAQAAGLKCLFADTITSETDFTGNCEFLSLESPLNTWVEAILAMKNYKRENMKSYIENAGYDIKKQTEWLQNFYLTH
ncbi:MAG: glycosyltransferase [Oscillospiraceae bacterium]